LLDIIFQNTYTILWDNIFNGRRYSMRNFIISLVLITGFLMYAGTGCTKRPSEEELNKLNEARIAAEAAEKKLAELRAERAQLESTLEAKKEELRKAEEERDAIKEKLGE
jgi:septal ring factor EnvC (AmiA/AmiB activator)